MTETYTFTNFEVEDLLHSHAYEIAEMLENTYDEMEKQLKEVAENDERK